jgi:4-amino-4-deoxy-L-arabinose transferase-like glycosyltransferase
VRDPKACFAGFALLHVAVWTTLPLLVTHSLPVDLVEGVIWGQGWRLGYDQPPFQAWLLGAVDSVSGYQRWAVYLTSQLLIAVAFWAVWKLSRLIVRPLGALVAVVLLEDVLFFNWFHWASRLPR